jgi:hypothetical protein
MAEIVAGYYTIEDTQRGGITICRVDEEEDEVEIMSYTPGYTRQDVFGAGSIFRVLAGPWEPPNG